MNRNLLAVAVFCCLAASASSPESKTLPGRKPEIPLPENIKSLPLRFEPNEGQWDPRIRFRTRSGALTAWVTDRGAKFVLASGGKAGDRRDRSYEPPKTAVVGMEFKGAKTPSAVSGLELAEGVTNYYLGSDPSRWRTNVPNYRKVAVKDVYPGIDAVYYGNGTKMEYDFVVAPGADPSKIEVSYDGVDSMRISERGDVVLVTGVGEIRQLKPRVFQDVAGRKVELAGEYKITANGTVAFRLGGYDPSKPVVIDPLIDFSTYYGGSALDTVFGAAGDATGVYVAGYTFSTNLPVSSGLRNPAGEYDSYLTKFNSSGSGLVYSTYFGGNRDDFTYALALDDQGSTYIGGNTLSQSLPNSNLGFQATQGGGTDDAWMAKFNSAGQLVFSSFYGGTGIEAITGIAVDSARNIYAIGQTTSSGLSMNGFQNTYGGNPNDGFIIKVAAAGSSLIYRSFLGGNLQDLPEGIAVDSLGQAIIGGRTYSKSNFPLASALQTTHNATVVTGFVMKVNQAGTGLIYSTYFGGSGLADEIWAVATDLSGAAYFAGGTLSTNFPVTTGSFDTSHNGSADGFVGKLAPLGNSVLFSTFLGSTGEDAVYRMAVDGASNVYVGGQTSSAGFPLAGPTQGFGGVRDAFLTQINSSGTGLLFSTFIGGSQNDIVRGVAVDSQNRIIVAGITETPFPTQNAYDSTPNGANDGFVMRFSDTGGGGGGPVITAPTPGQVLTSTGVTFSWNGVGGSAGYSLRITQGASTVFQGNLSGGNSTSTLISLQNGSYTFSVASCTNAALTTCGAFSSVSFSVSLPTPNGVPSITFPAQGAVLTTSIHTLGWTGVAGATRYEVLLTNTGTNQVDLTIGVPVTSTVYQMSSGNYRLQVRACIEACGAYSSPVTFTVQLPPVPTQKPNPPSCQVIGGNQLQCTWTSIPNADSYILQVVQPNAGPGGGALTVASSNDSATSATIPVPQGSASVFLQGCNGDGCGPNSDPLPINPAGPNPSSPVLGTPIPRTKVVGPGVFFSWNRIAGDNGSNTVYRLFAQDFSRAATAADVLTTSNFFAIQFKASGNRYDALVVARPGPSQIVGPATPFNVKGSDPVSPTLVIPRHQTAEVTDAVPQGNVTLGWTPLTGATLYEYFVAIPGGAGLANGVTPGLLVQIPISVPSGSTISGIVRACPAGQTCTFGNNAGWGAWSNTAGATGVTNFRVQ